MLDRHRHAKVAKQWHFSSLYKTSHSRFLLSCSFILLFYLQITFLKQKMNTQSAYPHRHGEGEDDQHHEKNSVLKKVKAKAKKIKDTIKKHGHGHNHDHGHEYHEGHIPDDHDLDEEDDEEEDEIVQDPEVHGAPMYESAAAKIVVSGQPEDLSRPGITNEMSKPMILDPLESRGITGNYGTKDNEPPSSAVGGLEGLVREQPRVDFGKRTDAVGEPLAPQNTPMPSSQGKDTTGPTRTFLHGEGGGYSGQPKVNLQRPIGLEEDPAAPKDNPDAYVTTNYQSKVTDPIGEGGEARGITPLLHSMDKMSIYEEDKGRKDNLPPPTHPVASELYPTGSHNQFSPGPSPPLDTETMDTKPEEHPRNVAADEPVNQSSYTEKISSATSVIADKAVSAKNIVASKLGYGEKDESRTTTNGSSPTTQGSAIDYGKKMAATMADKLSPVYEKVAGAGSTMVSKLHGPGSGTAIEVYPDQVQDQDKGVSMKSYIAEKLKPGEEDRALSEVISEALQKRKEEPEKETTAARGKVTESEEVARRLGTTDETNERVGSGSMNSPTKSVVDKLKGTVGSWFGKSEVSSQGTEQGHGSSSGNNGVPCSTGERRLQESGN
ncbi:hypothetical protein ES288_A12G291600v1 [Gossypium darwinii]|uniref:Low-temperature-induced 65 kDa protein n=1 Tax=Gossypium darwinii TaxID=34276 RepID=A0A5D2EET9_GOSDA|nr:hypothetical protein ES288_A12G291600v1 [Gossypium darwinii]